jgi:glycosyltransferase involved in cell wall biosynthesis
MRLLCVGNGCFTVKSSGLLTNCHTAAFLQELTRDFDHVRFMQMVMPTIPENSLNDSSLNDGPVEAIAVRVNGSSRLRKALSLAKVAPSLLRQIKNADYLYLFVPGPLSLLVATWAALLGVPFGVYLRGERRVNTQGVRWILSRADFVNAEGGTLAEKARPFCKDVDLTIPMFDLTDKECIANRCFRSQPPWNLLYVGRVEPQKGIVELIEAACMLKDQGIDFRLNIVGDGASFDEMKSASEGRLGQHVSFLGLIADRRRLFSLYEDADLFVFPSHDEGFPRVLYEAMAFQMPIVTTFVGSIGWLMRDNVNCLRISVGNPVELASTIEKSLRDVDLRRRLACNGNNTIRQLLQSSKGGSHAQQVGGKIAKYAKAK